MTEGVEPTRLGGRRGPLARGAELALAAAVVSVVGMMIVPLPPWLLDLLISTNIAAAVTLLAVSLHVSDALQIATFPTLLLLTTLFRLALEVSATRLILVRGHAGEVIQAFGSFVVAGNLIAGVVIFLILTIVQLVVVAKGAERVAEVAARFTLDALPGRQMAIDAELRAGHIDRDEAARRRATLTRESQLFGAMDGAMKFVKGDAIAGIVIVLVNIAGGFVIGVLQRGMSAADAARTYALLTIGGGLVAQIPALIISTAAGIVVTRVASDDEAGGWLGRDIAAQIAAHPRALAAAAVLLVGLALVPGLPFVPFVTLGALFGAAGWRLTRPRRRAGGLRSPGLGARGAQVQGGRALVARVGLDLSPQLAGQLASRSGDERISELVSAVRERLFADIGVTLPEVDVTVDPTLAAGAYTLRLDEVPVARGELPEGSGAPPGPVGALADRLLAALRRRAHELVGLQETQVLLATLERTDPALVREVVPKIASPALITDVLRRLAAEGVSLRNLRAIVAALARWAPVEKDACVLAERVRAALARAITFKHAAPDGALPAYTLDPLVEETIRGALHRTASGTVLALEPPLSRDIVAAVGRALASDGQTAKAAVILTAPEIRRHVRRLVEIDHPDLAVVSYDELTPETQVRTLGRITV